MGEDIAIIERFELEAPRTRQVVDLLRKIGSGDRKVLILTDGINSNVYLSARNLQRVSVLPFQAITIISPRVAGKSGGAISSCDPEARVVRSERARLKPSHASSSAMGKCTVIGCHTGIV